MNSVPLFTFDFRKVNDFLILLFIFLESKVLGILVFHKMINICNDNMSQPFSYHLWSNLAESIFFQLTTYNCNQGVSIIFCWFPKTVIKIFIIMKYLPKTKSGFFILILFFFERVFYYRLHISFEISVHSQFFDFYQWFLRTKTKDLSDIFFIRSISLFLISFQFDKVIVTVFIGKTFQLNKFF